MDEVGARRRMVARRSAYGQVKVLVTFSANRVASYRVYTKPYNQPWTERQCIAMGREELGHFPAELEEALGVVSAIIEKLRWAPDE